MQTTSVNSDMAEIEKYYVIKRNGNKESIQFDKIVRRIRNLIGDNKIMSSLNNIDLFKIAQKVISGVFDGISTYDIDVLTAKCCEDQIIYNPDYGVLASRIILSNIHKNTQSNFSEAIDSLYNAEIINEHVHKFVMMHKQKFDEYIAEKHARDFDTFDYRGIKSLESVYLLKINDKVIERPQYMFMRVSVGIHVYEDCDDEVKFKNIFETYELLSQSKIMHASPTLFNSGTCRNQLSSCFLVNMEDSIDGIFECISECAKLSKYAGGIGVHMSDVRANNAIIKGTNGVSNGILPWLRILNQTAKGVNQGGRRPGSFAAYLDVWHADIYTHLDIRLQSGNEDERARDLFTAVNLNNEFMKCVQDNNDWYLMCPKESVGINEVYGDDFKELYWKYVREGKYKSVVKARDVMLKIIESQFETGTPYLLNKDVYNEANNQKNLGILKGSNLCAEILIRTTPDEIGTCNLANLLLGNYVKVDKSTNKAYIDYDELITCTGVLVKNLNKIIDNNFYVLEKSKKSNMDHRPIAIGVQGLADVFFKMGCAFSSDTAREINKTIFEAIYYGAIKMSMELAKENPSKVYSSFKGSPFSKGIFQFDMMLDVHNKMRMETDSNTKPPLVLEDILSGKFDWDSLRNDVIKYGMVNSLLTSLMPTASTSNIMSQVECFEPIKKNLYYRKGLSGTICIPNKYLVNDLIKLGMWNDFTIKQIQYYDGSIQEIKDIPEDIREKYLTAYEIKQKDIINMSSDRQFFVDQTQSLNLFVSHSNIGKMNSMYLYAWKMCLKTINYYIRSTAATNGTQIGLQLHEIEEIKKKEKEYIEKSKIDENILICKRNSEVEASGGCSMCE